MVPSDKTREILKKVRQVEIRTNRMVTDAMAGAYHSVFKGQGMDFDEVREYAPGDEVRAIDWNVTAKMDRPFVKKFREERELTIMLLVDLSASGDFGSNDQSKRELMAELASLLAFSATRNNDKIGLILFTSKVEKFIYPQKGRQHVLRVIREVLYFEPTETGTDIEGALRYMNQLLKRKAIAFLLSDFLQGENNAMPLPTTGTRADQPSLFRTLSLTNQRHDLTCICLNDPRENELPNIGVITLEDSETGQLIEIDTGSPQVRAHYSDENKKRLQSFQRALRQAGIDHLLFNTDEPYVSQLRLFFERRGKRR